MGWNVESTKSTFNATENVINTISGRDSMRSGRADSEMSWQTQIFGNEYSIVGINANKVPEMREAIRNYVRGIQTHLDGFEAAADSSMAFQSVAVKESVRKYMETVKEYCQNLVSQLLAFSDKLKEVEEKWMEATQNMAQSVDTTRTNFNQGTTYQEKK